MIDVYDDVVPNPIEYRKDALARAFGDAVFGEDVFKGIAEADPIFGDPNVTMTFFRKSPRGQEEPNYIHSDAGMGSRTGIFYLNPDPPEHDGTTFWKSPDGWISGPWTKEVATSARARKDWVAWKHVPAKFNRLVIFDADLFHSRGIKENYGRGDEARLIQVMFFR